MMNKDYLDGLKEYLWYSQEIENSVLPSDKELLGIVNQHNENLLPKVNGYYDRKDVIRDNINLAYMSFWDLEDEEQEKLLKFLIEEIEEDNNNTKILELGGDKNLSNTVLELTRTDEGNIIVMSQKNNASDIKKSIVIMDGDNISDYFVIRYDNLIRGQDINIEMLRIEDYYDCVKGKRKLTKEQKEERVKRKRKQSYLSMIKKHQKLIEKTTKIKEIIDKIYASNKKYIKS